MKELRDRIEQFLDNGYSKDKVSAIQNIFFIAVMLVNIVCALRLDESVYKVIGLFTVLMDVCFIMVELSLFALAETPKALRMQNSYYTILFASKRWIAMLLLGVVSFGVLCCIAYSDLFNYFVAVVAAFVIFIVSAYIECKNNIKLVIFGEDRDSAYWDEVISGDMKHVITFNKFTGGNAITLAKAIKYIPEQTDLPIILLKGTSEQTVKVLKKLMDEFNDKSLVKMNNIEESTDSNAESYSYLAIYLPSADYEKLGTEEPIHFECVTDVFIDDKKASYASFNSLLDCVIEKRNKRV